MDPYRVYLIEFNFINHTKLEVDDLFCYKCKNIFNSTIYSGYIQNICEQCYKAEVTDLKNQLTENLYLKKQLEKAEFPCKYDPCTFRGVLSAYHDHIQICAFAPMPCPIDKVLCDDASEFVKHFSEHKEVEERCLESLSTTVEIDLNDMKEKKIILATFKNQVFVVFMELWGNSVLFQVGRHSTSCISSEPNFTVVYQSENMEIKLKGEICPFKTLFQSQNPHTTGSMLKISLLQAQPKVTIYFMDYEQDNAKNRLNDCPICFQPLRDTIFQCNNGHSFCVKCSSNATNCHVCRGSMIKSCVKLAHVLSQHYFPCENVDLGCGEMVNFRNKIEHGKICCFKTLVCPECKDQCTQQNFYCHFKVKHQTLENFSTQIWTLKRSQKSRNACYNESYGGYGYDQYDGYSKTGTNISILPHFYILYRARIFCIEAKYNFDLCQFEFGVKLIGNEKHNASKYRYEISYLKGNDDIIARVGNTCLNENNGVNYNSSITLEKCSSPKENAKVRAQCIILNNCKLHN